ncbi:MAG: cupin domain-containing protein [Clostridia bacterium]|nr:cupin domain-containing protein [Clostridia bacterium]
MSSSVVYNRDIPLTDLGGGVSRKVLAHNDQLMIVEVRFEKGGVGSMHTHPHLQSTYVQSGRFVFTIDGVEHEVAQGDTIAFASDVPHGTVCLEAGVLVDIFNPMREDFLK